MFSLEHYTALRQRAGIVDRSDRGRILLQGQDRRSYLQGLLTNDIAALTAGTGCYAALLTPQGRMIADMRVLETGDRIVIDLPAAVSDAVREHFARFVFSEDVEVRDLTASEAQIGVFGPQAARVAGALAGLDAGALDVMPLFANREVRPGGGSALLVRSDETGVEGFELFVGADGKDRVIAALRSAGAVDVDADAVEVCRIEAGRPAFGIDMDADTIPLEAGIEDRAISFTKGCYVGQEIIIRVLHRGHGRVARRLVGLTFDVSDAVPVPGATIRSADREVGSVTSATRSPALDRPIALGYVHRDFIAPGTSVSVGAAQGLVSALPFVSP